MTTEFIPRYWSVAQPNPTTYNKAVKHIEEAVSAPEDLGVIAEVAPFLARVFDSFTPALDKPALLLYAADHGLTEEGIVDVSFPTTAEVLQRIMAGETALNLAAMQQGVSLRLVDVGVRDEVVESSESSINQLHASALAKGTKNAFRESAMTMAQVNEAFSVAEQHVKALYESGSRVLIPVSLASGGDSAAALVASMMSHVDVDRYIESARGGDDMFYYRQRTVLKEAAERAKTQRGLRQNPLEALAEYGGFELAALVGSILSAAERKMLIIIDGFISTVAFQVAKSLQPNVLYYCISAERQKGQAHQLLLQKLSAKPLLTLGMSHTEGVGGVMALPMLMLAKSLLSLPAEKPKSSQRLTKKS